MDRRVFLTGMAGILASGFAPAAIGSSVLMPVRRPLAPLRWEFVLPWSFEGTTVIAQSRYLIVPLDNGEPRVQHAPARKYAA
jgi:hypothetical protein